VFFDEHCAHSVGAEQLRFVGRDLCDNFRPGEVHYGSIKRRAIIESHFRCDVEAQFLMRTFRSTGERREIPTKVAAHARGMFDELRVRILE
jgi:hypothetical protein